MSLLWLPYRVLLSSKICCISCLSCDAHEVHPAKVADPAHDKDAGQAEAERLETALKLLLAPAWGSYALDVLVLGGGGCDLGDLLFFVYDLGQNSTYSSTETEL
jgi:hypothetical protein